MISYLCLIYNIKLKSKINSIRNFFKIFQQIDRRFLFIILLINSIFKFLCSIVTILVLEEVFLIFNNRYLVSLILLILLYAFSREDVEKTDSYLKKIQWTYLVSPSSKYKVSFYFWVIPSILNVFLKFDVTLPFILYILHINKFFGFFLVLVVLCFALIQNVSKLSDYLSSSEKKRQIFKVIIYKLFLLMISFYFANKVIDILTWVIDTLKILFKGGDYVSLNIQFEENLKSFFTTTFSLSEQNVGQYFILGLVFLIPTAIGYILNINRNTNDFYLTKSKKVIDHKKRQYLLKKLNLSFIQKVYFNQLKTVSNLFLFLVDNSEVYVVYYIIYIVGKNISNIFVLIYMFIMFFIILNSNIVHSLVIKDQDVFRNYKDINRMTYWKLSNHNIIDLYQIKRTLLSKVAIPLVIEQVFISYIVSLLITKNAVFYLWMTSLHILFCLLLNFLTKLNSRLSMFMVPYVFSKHYKTIKNAGTSEFELFIYDKIYNFYKLPIVLLAFIPLIIQMFFDYFNLLTLVLLVVCLIIYYVYTAREINLFIEKGKAEYEKICI